MIKSHKYLGVILDEHLTFQECIKSLSDSASRALGLILGLKHSLSYFNQGLHQFFIMALLYGFI